MSSKTENNIYSFLNTFNLPFNLGEAYLPVSYTDSTGAVLKGKSDFQLAIYGTVIHGEIKDSTLNSKTSKKTADAAMARLDPYRYAQNPSYYQCIHGWNHSATKIKLTQDAMTPKKLIVIFDKNPKKTKDCNTPALIKKHKIDYCTKETFRDKLFLAIFAAIPFTPPRADGFADLYTVEDLVPLKSGYAPFNDWLKATMPAPAVAI